MTTVDLARLHNSWLSLLTHKEPLFLCGSGFATILQRNPILLMLRWSLAFRVSWSFVVDK